MSKDALASEVVSKDAALASEVVSNDAAIASEVVSNDAALASEVVSKDALAPKSAARRWRGERCGGGASRCHEGVRHGRDMPPRGESLCQVEVMDWELHDDEMTTCSSCRRACCGRHSQLVKKWRRPLPTLPGRYCRRCLLFTTTGSSAAGGGTSSASDFPSSGREGEESDGMEDTRAKKRQKDLEATKKDKKDLEATKKDMKDKKKKRQDLEDKKSQKGNKKKTRKDLEDKKDQTDFEATKKDQMDLEATKQDMKDSKKKKRQDLEDNLNEQGFKKKFVDLKNRTGVLIEVTKQQQEILHVRAYAPRFPNGLPWPPSEHAPLPLA